LAYASVVNTAEELLQNAENRSTLVATLLAYFSKSTNPCVRLKLL
jgi:hypothetical protein